MQVPEEDESRGSRLRWDVSATFDEPDELLLGRNHTSWVCPELEGWLGFRGLLLRNVINLGTINTGKVMVSPIILKYRALSQLMKNRKFI